ncbi:MAG: hypothetical protein AB7V77_04930 [Candidatus Woesearchaeota archaeon]
MKIGFIGLGNTGNDFNNEIKNLLKTEIPEHEEILNNVEFININKLDEVKKYNFDLMYITFMKEENILKNISELNKTHIVGITHGNPSIEEIKKYMNNLIILNPEKKEVCIQYIIHQLQNLFLPSLVGLVKEDFIPILNEGFLVELSKVDKYTKNQHPIIPYLNPKSIKGIHLVILGNNKENSIDLDDINEIGELITTELDDDVNIIWTFIEDPKLKGTEKYFEMMVTKDI